jgi:general stress protein 26
MLLPDAARTLLQKPLVARMAVNDPNGYPHVVPVWFALDGNDVVVFGFKATRKVDYIQANPKGSIQIGGDPSGAPGFLLKGDFSLEADIDNHWARLITYAYEPKENADKMLEEWTNTELIVMRLTVQKVIKV